MVSVTSCCCPGDSGVEAEEAVTQLLGMPSTDRLTMSLSRPWLNRTRGSHALLWRHRELCGGQEDADAAWDHEISHRQDARCLGCLLGRLPAGDLDHDLVSLGPVLGGAWRLDGQQLLALLSGCQVDRGAGTDTQVLGIPPTDSSKDLSSRLSLCTKAGSEFAARGHSQVRGLDLDGDLLVLAWMDFHGYSSDVSSRVSATASIVSAAPSSAPPTVAPARLSSASSSATSAAPRRPPVRIRPGQPAPHRRLPALAPLGHRLRAAARTRPSATSPAPRSATRQPPRPAPATTPACRPPAG